MNMRPLIFAAVLAGTLPLIGGDLPRSIAVGKKNACVMTGKNTVIVVEKDAGKVTRFAAKELQTFLGEMFGTAIPVSEQPGNGVNLYVGSGKFAASKGLKIDDLARDGFFIRTIGKDIVIAGKDDPKADPEKLIQSSGVWGMLFERGSLFGVYDFLERFCGVRFYFPGELGTVVPKKSSITLPEIRITERPDMTERWYSAFWDGEYFEGENRKATINPAKNLNLLRRRTKTEVIPCTHGISNAFNLTARFYKTHPEYFALSDTGKRLPRNLCWSSNVTEEIYQDIKAYLTGRPASERGVGSPGCAKPFWHFAHFRKPYVDIFPEDGMQLCQCEKCKKTYQPERGITGIATELIWGNVIRWGNRLKEEKIDGILCMSSYTPYKEMPKEKVPDNILLLLTATGPWAVDTPAGDASNELTRAWVEKTGRKAKMWNYAYKGYGTWKMTGIPAYTPLCVGKYYSQVGPYLAGVFLESESDRFLYFAMNNYILCKMAWDIKADYKAMLDEFYVLMFGPAAQIMQKQFEEFEEICTKKIVGRTVDTAVGPVSSVPSDNEVWNKIYTPAKLKEITANFDEAAKLVKPGSLEARRIELFRREYLNPLLAESARFLEQTKAVQGLRFDIRYPVWLVPYGKLNEKAVRTKVTAAYTENDLVFTLDCEEPEMAKTVAKKRSADDPQCFMDNDIEIFLNPTGDRKEYFQIVVNSAGSITDYKWQKVGKSGSTNDIGWNSGATAVVTPAEKGFTVKVTVPLKNLPKVVRNGFPVNFCRHRVLLDGTKMMQDFYSWSPYADGFHDLDNFGVMTDAKNELIVDGGFDTFPAYGNGNRHWGFYKDGIYCGWIGQGKKDAGEWCERDDKVYFSYPYSMKFGSRTGKPSCMTQYFTRPLKPNTKYRLRYMVRTENVVGKGGLFVNVVDCHNNFFPRHNWISGNTDWTCMDFVFRTENKPISKDSKLQASLYFATGTVWLDNVSLEEIE